MLRSESGSEPIRFGTSGWRGVMGEEITLPRVAALASAVAAWLKETSRKPRVVVGYDGRPAGPRLADVASETLLSHGVEVLRADRPIPTPVLSRAVAAGRHSAGLIFTASHNPPAYHGVKVFGPSGGVLEPEATRRIERSASAALRKPPTPGRRRGRVRPVDLVSDYQRALAERLDLDGIGRARPTVHYDAMHGVGAAVLAPLLASAGARMEVLRSRRDAHFGGGGPDPAPARLGELTRATRRGRGLRLGLANDGDADRYAAIDADGRILSASQAVALLVDHLARSGRIERGVAISVATGALVERVAASHGLRVERNPIGFKWLSRSLVEGRSDCAGEESGGFVWGATGVDKDGILAAALLTELVATSGAPLGERLATLEARHGRSHCGRTALPASEMARDRLARIAKRPPSRVLGARVTHVDRRDGVRLGLTDGFLMLRGSGTEPLLRIYAEGGTARALAARLAEGARWLGAKASGNLPN